MRSKRLTVVLGGAVVTIALTQCGGASQETSTSDGADWPMYRRDLAGTGYSPLTQITTGNAANLSEAGRRELAVAADLLGASARHRALLEAGDEGAGAAEPARHAIDQSLREALAPAFLRRRHR